jgi:hypothetical protein
MFAIRKIHRSFEALVKASGGPFARMVKAAPAMAASAEAVSRPAPPHPPIIKAAKSAEAVVAVEKNAAKSSSSKPVRSAKGEPEKASAPDPDRYTHLKPTLQAPQIFTDAALSPSGQLADAILAAGQKARTPTNAPPIDTTTAHGVAAAAIIAAGKKRRGETA